MYEGSSISIKILSGEFGTYCIENYIVKQKLIETEVFTIYVGGSVIH